MSLGKKPNPLLSPRFSSPSLGVSLCKRACIRRPWLDPSLILSLGILSFGGELQSQHEDWDEATSGREGLKKRCFVLGIGLEMYDDEVERASMVRWRFWLQVFAIFLSFSVAVEIRQAPLLRVKLIGIRTFPE